MAEHVYKSYTCDKCKCNLGNERPKRSQDTRVAATFNWSDGSGPAFLWKDLCDPCNDAIRAFFLPSLNFCTSTEKKNARLWFAEVLSYVNKDMADHIMVRARRMMQDWKP